MYFHLMIEGIKLVAIDVDGTLVDDNKNITEENLKAINWAHTQKGVHFTINSGRIAPSVHHYMEQLKVYEPYPSLGGVLVHSWDGQIMAENTINEEAALAINALSRSLGCTNFVYQNNTWYIDPGNDFWVQSEIKATNIMGHVLNTDIAIKSAPTHKMLGVSLETPKLQHLMSEIQRQFSLYVDCSLSSPNFLEILPKGINKGTAINALKTYYGLEKNNIMAIGDYYNDIDMFNVAGISVAMCNAPKDVQQEAKYITKSDNIHSGVAEAIYKFIK